MRVETTQSRPVYGRSERPEVPLLPELAQVEEREREKAIAAEKLTNAVVQFSQDAETGKMLMRMVSPDTGEVFRQIPSQELLTLSKVLGPIVDKMA